MMPPKAELIVQVIVITGMLLSLPTLIIPIFPGITVIWALALIYGLIFGFGSGGGWFFGGLTVLAAIGWVSDNIIMSGKARQGGARWSSILIALGVGFVSSIVLTPIAGIPLTLLALFLSEYAYCRDAAKAWDTTKQMLIGWGWAFAARVLIGILMIMLWAIWVF